MRTKMRWMAWPVLAALTLGLTGCGQRELLTAISFGTGWLVRGLTGMNVETLCYRNGVLVDCSQLPAE